MTTRREALAALARRYPDDYRRIYQSIKNGTPIDEVTVAEWSERWMRLRERIVRPGTLDADRSAVRKWIVPTIGNKPLAGLLRADIRAVHEAMESAGLADSSVQRVHIALRKLLADAVDEGHDVPERTRRTQKPGGAGISQRQALSVDAARKILDVAMEWPDASRWVAAILQGMRPAEARGLRWSSLDLDRGLMTVEWQLRSLPYRTPRDPASGFRVPRGFESIRLNGAHHLVRPKTKSGIRVVPLVPWLRTELTAWSAIAPESPYDLVWTAGGRPMTPEYDRARWIQLAEAADVWVEMADGSRRRPLLYECRHTAATLLMASGADETTLTAIVGHSKIASTKAYLHSDESRKLAALEAVGAQLGVG
ncbi:tyrosine-type recombinase/integrase [Gordonia iterans]